MPRGAGFEIRIAHRACHFAPPEWFGEFLGSICRRMVVYYGGRQWQEVSAARAQLAFVEVR
jgi:hypothetical protein